MYIFLYSTVSSEGRRKLGELLKTALPKENIRVYQNFDELSARLKHPGKGESIGILAPGSRQELLEFLARRDLFRDIKAIIIAPDHEAETIALAYQLRPRFLTYFNDDEGDLAAVISKMVSSPASNGKMGGINKYE